MPEETGFNAMIERLKQSLHAFPLFDLAKLVLGKPQRYVVKLTRPPAADGQRPAWYYVSLSENPFLSRADAIRHLMRCHLKRVAREVKTPVEPPKGQFSFVNRCGITGVWLGAPNHHEYQSALVRHHQRRLRHMPFEAFKQRIQTVRDEAAVKAWLDAMSISTEYECALCQAPAAPDPTAEAATATPAVTAQERFPSTAELEQHLVEQHLAELVTELPEVTISGSAVGDLEQRSIVAAIRQAWDTERRFPIATVNGLRPRLQKAGFHFFKHPDGVVYLSQARLKRFEAGQVLTAEVQQILEHLRPKGGCTSQQLMAALLPAAATPPSENAVPTSADAPAAPATTTVNPAEEPILRDLRWLLTEGYAMELSDGRLWAPSEKAPLPSPPSPAPSAAPPPAATDPSAVVSPPSADADS